MVSRSLCSHLSSNKTVIIIDALDMIFPSRSQLASKQITRTGRAEAVTKEGLAATLLPARQPDRMGQRHPLRPVRPRSRLGPLPYVVFQHECGRYPLQDDSDLLIGGKLPAGLSTNLFNNVCGHGGFSSCVTPRPASAPRQKLSSFLQTVSKISGPICLNAADGKHSWASRALRGGGRVGRREGNVFRIS